MADDTQIMSSQPEADAGNYSYHSEDPQKFVLQHPDGSLFSVPKSYTNENQQAFIRNQIPPAKETSVGQDIGSFVGKHLVRPVGQALQDAIGAEVRVGKGIYDIGRGIVQGASDEPPAAASLPPQAEASQSSSRVISPTTDFVASAPRGVMPEPGQDPYAAIAEGYKKGFGLSSEGIKGEAAAQGALGKEEANVAENTQNYLKQEQEAYSNELSGVREKIDRFNNELSDPEKQIDSNRYWDNKSTGNKVLAAIAVALGGMGSQWTGGRNLALDTINGAINRDLESQKLNISNKQNLLGKMMDQEKNVQYAHSLSRAHLLSVAELQVKSAIARSLDPMAQARGKQLLGQLELEKNNQMLQLANMGYQRRLKTGEATQQELAAYGDKDIKAASVPLSGGKYAVATSPEAATDVRKYLTQSDVINKSLDELEKLGPSAAIPMSKENLRAKSLMANILTGVSKDEGLKPRGEFLANLMREQFGDPTSIKRFIGVDPKTKSSQLREVLENEKLSVMKNNLLNYQPQMNESPKVKSERPTTARR